MKRAGMAGGYIALALGGIQSVRMARQGARAAARVGATTTVVPAAVLPAWAKLLFLLCLLL
jgi:hypothetical protein